MVMVAPRSIYTGQTGHSLKHQLAKYRHALADLEVAEVKGWPGLALALHGYMQARCVCKFAMILPCATQALQAC